MSRVIRAATALVATLGMTAATVPSAQREPVLKQIDLPHSYYYREMYLPQLTSGPSSVAWSPDGQALVYSMTLRPNSIVYEIVYDDSTRRATGVRVLDTGTNEHLEFNAKVIFLCASTFGSTHIMLNSVSKRFPNGFGNDSGELGCNIMDSHLHVGATATPEGFEDRYYFGNRPNDLYIPRYRNLGGERRDYIRGFGYQGGAERIGWTRLLLDAPLGGAVKTMAPTPGPWRIKLDGFGEILPNHANRVTLDKTRKDKWGLPLLSFDAVLRDNEFKMRKDMQIKLCVR